MVRVLVVDDDEKILKVLVAYLVKAGYKVETSQEGWDAVTKVWQLKPDVVLLDIMLPGLDGWGVCKEIRRASNVPIIMLTARDGETDRIIGLDIGADDYVTKPFSPREIIARIRAILRRVQPDGRRSSEVDNLHRGDLTLQLRNHILIVKDKPVAVTPTEYKLLELFLSNPGQVFSRLQLNEKRTRL